MKRVHVEQEFLGRFQRLWSHDLMRFFSFIIIIFIPSVV